jgi:hypothetical protein
MNIQVIGTTLSNSDMAILNGFDHVDTIKRDDFPEHVKVSNHFVDTFSSDRGAKPDCQSHRTWLKLNTW